MSKHPIVIQGTSFLQAKKSYLLTEKELAIVLEIVSMVDSTDEDDKDYEWPVQEWYEILGITGSNKELQFKNVFQNLMMKIVEIPREGRGWLLTHWISSVLYSKNTETVKIGLTPELRPYFLHLKHSLKLE